MEYFSWDKPLAKELSIYLIELKGEKQFLSLVVPWINILLSASNVGYSFQLTRDFVSRRIDRMSPLSRIAFKFRLKIHFRNWLNRWKKSHQRSAVTDRPLFSLINNQTRSETH